MIRFFSLLIFIFTCLCSLANPDWRIHPSFFGKTTRIIDTPSFVYYASTVGNNGLMSLFRYDKDAEELIPLSSDNLLTDNLVSAIEYSPEKHMLMVALANHDINILYDNGETATIFSYRTSSATHNKLISDISFSQNNDRAYLSTPFGFVVIDTRNRQVAESRVYGTKINSVAQMANRLFVISDGKLMSGDALAPPHSISDYSVITLQSLPKRLVTLSSGQLLLLSEENGEDLVSILSENDGFVSVRNLFSGKFTNISPNTSGVLVKDYDRLIHIDKNGSFRVIPTPSEHKNLPSSSDNLSEIWSVSPSKGLWSENIKDGIWKVSRSPMLPDSPAPFISTDMIWHDDYGLLVTNHGYDPNFTDHNDQTPLLLSAYRNGRWSNISPIFLSDSAIERIYNPNGIAVDPNNPLLVYFGSLLNGLERIDTSDGNNILHMSRINDPMNYLPGFVAIVNDQSGNLSSLPDIGNSWTESCSFAAPAFDNNGNLWTAFADFDDQMPMQLHLYCWDKDARRNSTSASTLRPPVRVKIPGYMPGNRQRVIPLRHKSNSNLIAYTNRAWTGEIVIVNTNGTPTDSNDDITASISSFHDQDGTMFDVNDIRFIWENQVNGNLWVGHRNGVFEINPKDILSGSCLTRRPKISRNDGSLSADYLLDGVSVNAMTVDCNGNLWFATSGAGLVVTSSDGKTIKETFTSDTSPLPDNLTYGLAYNPESNSILVSTASGMAEYFIKSESSSSPLTKIRAYPNPVRPDYLGTVRIDGLPEDALVKIIDSSGNLVKELERAFFGETTWDVTNMSATRASSGVYFILASPGSSSDSFSKVGKILVIN